jgi:hypothetical protein
VFLVLVLVLVSLRVLYFVGFDCYFGRAVPCLTSLAYCKIFQKNEKDSDDDR